jgi:hypothetical protein
VGVSLAPQTSIDASIVAINIASTVACSSIDIASLNNQDAFANELSSRRLILILIELLSKTQVVD